MLTCQQKLARRARWICAPCALDNGAKYRWGHLSTLHYDTCGVCGHDSSVTEPSDFIWEADEARDLDA